MAGHSHWAGIKYKKGINDAKRGQLFTKLGRMITVAARQGGGDINANFALRHAVEKAKAANMPKENIEKAIKRGTGELEGTAFEELTYEGYGPGGVAILVEALTDNRNRTTPEIRKIFESKNGSIGETGCVSWMFKKKGLFTIPKDEVDEDKLMEISLDNGAEDINLKGDIYEVICSVKDFEQLSKALKEGGIKTQVAEITYLADMTVSLDKENAKKVLALVEALDDHEDVQNVHANFVIDDEILKEIQK